jgi:hypothetical protein
MKWTKLGKIFDPSEHELPHGCFGFSQGPQTLVMGDRVRVYFSTRKRDAVGKYLSHVAFVDFEKNMRNIISRSKHTVIALGDLGCFDEHGIFPINLIRDGDRVLAFTTGWNRKVSVSADASIGLAISHDDGWTFQKYGRGPVLAPALHEPFLIGDACVVRSGGLFHMWYIFGTKWEQYTGASQPERVYKIAHATSTDAINWRRESRPIIADRLNADECQALPAVFRHDGMHHRYFCYRQAHGFRKQSDSGYRLGYARSTNLIEWERDDGNAGIDISEEGWDAEMQCYPHAFELDGKIYLLYNGNDFGRHGFGLAILEN